MKLRNWLPTKYLTEENPVIGMSFEVGYARMAVMVGQTIIHTMSNMIQADYDSQILRCIPAYMYHSRQAALQNSPGFGGFRRQDTDLLEIHSARTPRYRSALQYTGMAHYRDFNDYSVQLLELRRNQKAANFHPAPSEIAQMHRFLNSPYLYQRIGSMGHMDRDQLPAASYLTQKHFEGQMRRAAVEAGFGELDYMQRKLLNNSYNGIPRKESGHSSMTAARRTIPKYRLTDMHGSRGVVVPVYPVAKDIIHQFVGHKAAARLAEKYIFTGEGMLPKDL